MRILFLTAWFPEPPSNGSRARVHGLLRALQPRHHVTLLSFADEPGIDPAAPRLRELCQAVEIIPPVTFDPHTWSSRLAWVRPAPRSLAATYSPAMAAAIRRVLIAGPLDVVIASQLRCAAYAGCFGDVPALFEEVELGALHAQLAAAPGPSALRARLMWGKYVRYLQRLVPRFRACTVVSAAERNLLQGIVGGAAAIHVLPNAVEPIATGTTARDPHTVIFTGALRYRPNYDGMRWFLTEVWPRVQRARPAARLLITGAHDDLPLPPAANVTRTGVLADVASALATATVAIAPIFAGGGTRVKILDAMAAGTPVVATHKGAEGLDAIDGEHLLIADTSEAFAEHVLALMTDAALHARIAAAARAFVAAHHDWRRVGPAFEALVASVARRETHPPP
jgi:glycosyltransferase involved in cell wall biosynthesis